MNAQQTMGAKSITKAIPTQAVYRRRRMAVGLALALALGGTIAGFAATGQAQASNQVANVTFEYITVHSGDTLWSLAGTYAQGQDQRDWIAATVELNALDDTALQPGQQLALPKH
jgi:hypothetical protein